MLILETRLRDDVHDAGNEWMCFYKKGGEGSSSGIGHLVVIDRGMLTCMCVLRIMRVICLIIKNRSNTEMKKE